jgi:16S rRNA (adenine1518-N6/adenine1519-N6)-dimethyltransferase
MKQKARLGQNFLVSATAQRAIADALGDVSGTAVVEIGPGKAAITDILAARARKLIAIELDSTLGPALRTRFLLSNEASGRDRVEVLLGDVLRVDFTALAGRLAKERVGKAGVADGGEDGRALEEKAAEARAAGMGEGSRAVSENGGARAVGGEDRLAVVGNLPYYITSDILLHLFRHEAVLSRAVLMVQREVADRIVAEPGTSEYGILSATCQLYARVERLFTLGPEAFSPPPEVHSSVVRLVFAPRFAELGVEAGAFLKHLRVSFAQKRKTLANNLRAAGFAAADIARALGEAGVEAQARAETLTLEEQARVFLGLRALEQTPG